MPVIIGCERMGFCQIGSRFLPAPVAPARTAADGIQTGGSRVLLIGGGDEFCEQTLGLVETLFQLQDVRYIGKENNCDRLVMQIFSFSPLRSPEYLNRIYYTLHDSGKTHQDFALFGAAGEAVMRPHQGFAVDIFFQNTFLEHKAEIFVRTAQGGIGVFVNDMAKII